MTHGNRKSAYRRRGMPEYKTWQHMKSRCLVKTDPNYKNYGGRGISVCKEWVESFEAFYEHVGSKPGPEYSIDRINNDGDYEPGNVQWATRSQQNKNRRPFKMGPKKPRSENIPKSIKRPYEHKGSFYSLSELSEKFDIPKSILESRLQKHKWDVERAITTPIERYEYRGVKYTLRELSDHTGVELSLLRSRILKYGWSIERAVHEERKRPNIFSSPSQED